MKDKKISKQKVLKELKKLQWENDIHDGKDLRTLTNYQNIAIGEAIKKIREL